MSEIERAIQKMQGGDFRAAVVLLSSLEPSFQVCNYLGIAHQMNRDWSGARSAWETALEYNSDAIDVRLNLGIACIALEDKSAAERYWLDIVEIDPNHVQSLINLGLLYREQDCNQKAHDCWERALQAQPELPKVIEWLADVKGVIAYAFLQKGNIERASDLLHQAIAMDTSHSMLWGYLAELYWLRGDIDDGIHAGRKAIELEPDNPDFYQTLITLYRAKGNESEALQLLREIEQLT